LVDTQKEDNNHKVEDPQFAQLCFAVVLKKQSHSPNKEELKGQKAKATYNFSAAV
jgi:hypothetical protein